MHSRKSVVVFLIAGLLVSISVWIAVAAFKGSNNASAHTKTIAPASMIGKWQENDATNGVIMKATITPGAIQINMVTRDSTSIFWLGTFDSDKDPSKPFKTISNGDTDALKLSIMGSNEKTKLFTYKNGVLSFEFSMMGTSTTIHLSFTE